MGDGEVDDDDAGTGDVRYRMAKNVFGDEMGITISF